MSDRRRLLFIFGGGGTIRFVTHSPGGFITRLCLSRDRPADSGMGAADSPGDARLMERTCGRAAVQPRPEADALPLRLDALSSDSPPRKGPPP